MSSIIFCHHEEEQDVFIAPQIARPEQLHSIVVGLINDKERVFQGDQPLVNSLDSTGFDNNQVRSFPWLL